MVNYLKNTMKFGKKLKMPAYNEKYLKTKIKST